MTADAPTRHRYGEHPDQFAELTRPEGVERPPVAVLIHGGFWRERYDASLMHPMVADLDARGWATWNIEYRRGPGAGLRTLADLRAAIDALAGTGAALDRDRLCVIGHSAGGHLALLSALFADPRLVVSLAGVADLRAAEATGIGNGAAREFVGSVPAEDPPTWTVLDPIAAIPTRRATLLVHGDADEAVPLSQSHRYLAAARAAEDPCELLQLPGVDHMALIDPASEAFRAWVARL